MLVTRLAFSKGEQQGAEQSHLRHARTIFRKQITHVHVTDKMVSGFHYAHGTLTICQWKGCEGPQWRTYLHLVAAKTVVALLISQRRALPCF